MEDLARFYLNSLRTVALIIGSITAFVATKFAALTAKFLSLWFIHGTAIKYSDWLVTKLLLSGTMIGILFGASEWLIREKIWRWYFVHRSLNFEDDWLCVTFYEAVETRDAARRDSFRGHHVYHEARIRQDARRIKIGSSYGQEFNGWESLMMDMTASSVAYTYTVEYAEGSNLKGKAIGYEQLKVGQRYRDPKKGIPILLDGTFAHCAQGQPEVFSGSAVFCRAKYLDKIKIEETMKPKLRRAIQIIKGKQANARSGSNSGELGHRKRGRASRGLNQIK